jgi:hypothetical protein
MRNVIGYIVVGLQRGFSLERVVSPLSPDTSSRCQYVIVTYCYLSLLLIYLNSLCEGYSGLAQRRYCREALLRVQRLVQSRGL